MFQTDIPSSTGQVIGGLNTRRGTIMDSDVRDEEFTCVAEVPLNDMFGYSNQLRGSTQGKGEKIPTFFSGFGASSYSLLLFQVNSAWNIRYLLFVL